ncbi:diuretic hormone receptor-like isoform X2 [Brevipalpus obovatus]
MHLINYFGYSISIIALLTALIIFAYFKDLHCIRNTIHANFMISHLFVGVTWIVTALIQRDESEVFRLECLLYIILIYFNVTTFFWMFIEGLYLYILVLKTFSIERIKKHTYLFIGWGLPVILVSVWTPLKYYFPHVLYIFTSPQKTKSNCPWSNNEAIVDHVCIVLPILFILLANIFFLGMVIYVLVTQLCISTAAEFQQYRKAAKALLVLTPLLGITYALILVAPESTPGVLVGYLHSFLFSTQGLTVAVLYCFLNSEVRNSLRYHVTRWKAVRMLKTGHYPIPVPYSLKMRPRQTMRCNRLRYTFSANGNSCIVTGRSNDSKSSFQESVSHFPAVIRYSSKSTKSTSLSEDFV